MSVKPKKEAKLTKQPQEHAQSVSPLKVIKAEEVKQNLKETTPLKKEEKSVMSTNVLQSSGLQDAYEYLLRQLCKKGLPTGNVYEFSAQTILKYEKKLNNKNMQLQALKATKDAHDKFVKISKNKEKLPEEEKSQKQDDKKQDDKKQDDKKQEEKKLEEKKQEEALQDQKERERSKQHSIEVLKEDSKKVGDNKKTTLKKK